MHTCSGFSGTVKKYNKKFYLLKVIFGGAIFITLYFQNLKKTGRILPKIDGCTV
jgi:hypothetical protein